MNHYHIDSIIYYRPKPFEPMGCAPYVCCALSPLFLSSQPVHGSAGIALLLFPFCFMFMEFGVFKGEL